jgi:hypothetical protein
MRTVIDSNFLQSAGLRAYLSKSPANIAVLTDYAAMEAHKANTVEMLYRSMAILSEFPKQVIVLKGTQAVCALRGRPSGLQRRMIDHQQTRGFAEYCTHLAAARRGNLSIQAQLLELGREARHQMDRILGDTQEFCGAVEDLANMYNANEIQIIRKGAPYTRAMAEKMLQQILMMARVLFDRHPRVTKLPAPHELPNTFLFRTALCVYLLLKRWISVGGAHQAKPERLRNDMIDISFAVYATYFDEFLTADRKIREIYQETDWFLKRVFSLPPSAFPMEPRAARR